MPVLYTLSDRCTNNTTRDTREELKTRLKKLTVIKRSNKLVKTLKAHETDTI